MADSGTGDSSDPTDFGAIRNELLNMFARTNLQLVDMQAQLALDFLNEAAAILLICLDSSDEPQYDAMPVVMQAIVRETGEKIDRVKEEVTAERATGRSDERLVRGSRTVRTVLRRAHI